MSDTHITEAQKRCLQQQEFYGFNTNPRTLDALIRKGLVQNFTDCSGSRARVYMDIFILTEKGHAALAKANGESGDG